jgi:hypothetical protein
VAMSRIARICGKSVSILDRWDKHIGSLNKNVHENKHLQRAWNKYSKDNFKFEILEECKEEELLDKEHNWVSNINTLDKNIGYNIVENYNSAPQNSKTYIITFPDGTESIIINIKRFCRDNNLNPDLFYMVTSGKINQYKGEWQKTVIRPEKKGGGWKGNWVVENINTSEEIIVKNLHVFCKNNNLNYAHMQMVGVSKRRFHRGYICRKECVSKEEWINNFAKKTPTKNIKWEVTDPNDNKYIVKSMNLFCKQNGLTNTAMFKIGRNLQRYHKGYTCRKLET